MSFQDNQRERERERESGDGENKSQREFEIDLRVFFFFYTYFGLNRTDSWPVSNWIGLYWPELGWIGKWEKKYAFAATLTAAQHIHACRTRVCWFNQCTCAFQVVWSVPLHCLMWVVWRKWNTHTFEVVERSILELKSILHFFFSQMSWGFLVIP